MEINLIDRLREPGGYSKEIKRRFVIKNITYLKKLEAKFNKTMLDSPTNNCGTARKPIYRDKPIQRESRMKMNTMRIIIRIIPFLFIMFNSILLLTLFIHIMYINFMFSFLVVLLYN